MGTESVLDVVINVFDIAMALEIELDSILGESAYVCINGWYSEPGGKYSCKANIPDPYPKPATPENIKRYADSTPVIDSEMHEAFKQALTDYYESEYEELEDDELVEEDEEWDLL